MCTNHSRFYALRQSQARFRNPYGQLAAPQPDDSLPKSELKLPRASLGLHPTQGRINSKSIVECVPGTYHQILSPPNTVSNDGPTDSHLCISKTRVRQLLPVITRRSSRRIVVPVTPKRFSRAARGASLIFLFAEMSFSRAVSGYA